MRATIPFNGRNHTYDTDEADVVAHKNHGSFGDPAGYEETLYKARNRQYFLYGVGGAESPYPEPAIQGVTKADGLARM